jgi:hypothetical protein
MTGCWFSDLEAHEAKVYSQSGEDGTLARLFDLIGSTNRVFVEFGAKDGVSLSNTANLRLHHGWTGLLMDGDPTESQPAAAELFADDTAARVREEIVTRENINDLLERYRVPRAFDLLSIDIDGNDYWVWKALEGYRPRVVLIEYNIFFHLGERRTIPYDPLHVWDESAFHGASLAALRKLGSEKGYELVYTDSFAPNAFFVSSDELPEPWDPVSMRRAARWGEFAERPDPRQTAWLDV